MANPFSSGWRDNLELYASFNSLKIINTNPAPYFGVRPKDDRLCPSFSDDDILLLNEAVPILARGKSNDLIILDEPKTKCYAIANEIVNNWVEKPADERTVCPQANTAVERIALNHMDINHIIKAEPKSKESLFLDVNFEEEKRNAILNLTLPMETIEARPKGIDKSIWFKVTKMTQPADTWNAFDGEKTIQVTTEEINKEWMINLAFNTFPNDKILRDKSNRSSRRRRYKKNLVLQRMAKMVAEAERQAKLKSEFDQFMNRPKEKQSFADFKSDFVGIIEKPSNHSVSIEFESEQHTMKVCAHGNNVSCMSQLVIDDICKTVMNTSTFTEKKTNRRSGGKVNKTRRGSDGIVKDFQIDQQHQQDLLQQGEDEDRMQTQRIRLCKHRLKELRKFATSPKYTKVWTNDGSLDLRCSHLTKPLMVTLLKVFNVEGRTKISKGIKDSIITVLETIGITQSSIEEVEEKLLVELRELGEVDDFRLNES